MPKESSQRKLELNYQTTDPCYGREGGKEEEMLTISRINRIKKEEIMVMAMEMGKLIEAAKNEDKTIKSNLKITSMRTTMVT